MGKGIRENPPTMTMDLTWSPQRKTYVLTVSYHAGTGRHGERWFFPLRNENRPEIDSNGARLLADAVAACYAEWLF